MKRFKMNGAEAFDDSLYSFLFRILNINPSYILLKTLDFSLLTTDSDRFDFAVKFLSDKDFLCKMRRLEVEGFKSLPKCVQLRQQGNKEFKCKNYEKALMLYTKSIAFAPQFDINGSSAHEGRSVLSLAVANRSAVLFELKKYELCLKDIAFATEVGYPDNLKYKLIAREEKCSEALRRRNILQSLFDISSEAKEKLLIQEYFPDSSTSNVSTSIYNMLQESKNIHVSDLIRNGKRGILPSFSDCVKIETTADMGRGLYATRDIDIGEVIAVEEPFFSMLDEDYFYTNCHHCCRQIMNLIPCFHCSMAMFCSKKCREQSWNKYHSIDCFCIPYMREMKLLNSALGSLKTVITGSKMFQDLTDFCDVVRSFESHNNELNFNNKYTTDDDHPAANYIRIFRLVTNAEHRNSPELMSCALTAACMVFLLELKTDFFSNIGTRKEKASSVTEIRNLIGCLLMKHIMNQVHCVHIYKFSNGNKSHDSVTIGRSIYPDISLINHSCNPNVYTGCYHGNQKIVITTRAVKCGEQLFENYNATFDQMGKQERQNHLSRIFKFMCKCTACTENWPLFEDIKDKQEYRMVLKCRKCDHMLPNCRKSAGLVKCTYCYHENDVTGILMEIRDKMYKLGLLPNSIDRSVKYLNHTIKALKILQSYAVEWSSEIVYFNGIFLNCFCQLLTEVDKM